MEIFVDYFNKNINYEYQDSDSNSILFDCYIKNTENQGPKKIKVKL